MDVRGERAFGAQPGHASRQDRIPYPACTQTGHGGLSRLMGGGMHFRGSKRARKKCEGRRDAPALARAERGASQMTDPAAIKVLRTDYCFAGN